MSAKKLFDHIATDPYRVLGIRHNATDTEIRDAFLKLAKVYHPDVNQGDAEAESKFKRISQAYALLTDPEQKKRYDLKPKKDRDATWKPDRDGNGKSRRMHMVALLAAIFVSGAAGLIAAEFFGGPTPKTTSKAPSTSSEPAAKTTTPERRTRAAGNNQRTELMNKLQASKDQPTPTQRIEVSPAADTPPGNVDEPAGTNMNIAAAEPGVAEAPKSVKRQPASPSETSASKQPGITVLEQDRKAAAPPAPQAEVSEPGRTTTSDKSRQAVVETEPRLQHARPVAPDPIAPAPQMRQSTPQAALETQTTEAPAPKQATHRQDTRQTITDSPPRRAQTETIDPAPAAVSTAKQETPHVIDRPDTDEPSQETAAPVDGENTPAPNLPDGATSLRPLQSANDVPKTVPPPSRRPLTNWTGEHKVTRSQSAFPPQTAKVDTDKALSENAPNSGVRSRQDAAGKHRQRRRPWHQHLWDTYFETHCTDYDDRRLECRPPSRAFRIKIKRFLNRRPNPTLDALDIMGSWYDFRFSFCRRMMNGYLMCRKPWA